MSRKTKNYSIYEHQMLGDISLGDLIRMEDMISHLCDLLPEQKEIVEEASALIEDVGGKLEKFHTGNFCPRCGLPLYLSDLPQYDEVCYECDENF